MEVEELEENNRLPVPEENLNGNVSPDDKKFEGDLQDSDEVDGECFFVCVFFLYFYLKSFRNCFICLVLNWQLFIL